VPITIFPTIESLNVTPNNNVAGQGENSSSEANTSGSIFLGQGSNSTSRCSGYTTTRRSVALKMEALQLSSEKDLLNKDSAQSKAIEWIILNDDFFLCPNDPSFAQRYFLALLYFSTNGNDWNSCAAHENSSCSGNRFLSSTSECSWTGCECDRNDQLTRINLDSNNLRGQIPNEIGALSHLFELDLDSNHLTGEIPTSVGQLSMLTFLDFDENKLTGKIPEEIYNLSLLRSLDLDTNQLTGTISTRIGLLPNLFIVQFDDNQMTGMIPTEAGKLNNLDYLTLHRNSFDGSIPEALCNTTAKIFANCNLCAIEGCCRDCLEA